MLLVTRTVIEMRPVGQISGPSSVGRMKSSYEVRGSLLLHITARPGLRIVDLARLLGANRGTVKYHLRVLESGSLIEREMRHGESRFFTANQGPTERRALTLLGRGRCMELARAIVASPGMHQEWYAKQVSIARKVLQPYIAELISEGLILQHPGGRRIHFRPAEKLVALVSRALPKPIFRSFSTCHLCPERSPSPEAG